MYSYPTYDIYICHSGIYSENYRKLIKLFNSGKGFCYRCHSDEAALPSMKKARGNFTEMYKKMQRNINASDCIILLLDKSFMKHARIRFEADYAAAAGKPIIVVNTDGSEMPEELHCAAEVNFSAEEIFCAVRQHCRSK